MPKSSPIVIQLRALERKVEEMEKMVSKISHNVEQLMKQSNIK